MRLTFDTDRTVSMALLGHLAMVAQELGGLRLASSIAILEVHPSNGEVRWTYTPMTSAESPETGVGSPSIVKERIAQLAHRIMEVPGARMQRYRINGNSNGVNGVPDDFTNAAYNRGVGYGDLTATNFLDDVITEDERWAIAGNNDVQRTGRSITRNGTRSRSPSPQRVGGTYSPNGSRSRSRSPRRISF